MEPSMGEQQTHIAITPFSYFDISFPSAIYREGCVTFYACAHALRNQMEQRAVICFFTLNGLKAKDIHAKLECLFGAEAFGQPKVKK
jgi:hypothetical protein